MALLRGWPSAATSIAVQASLNAAEEIHEVLAAALGEGALDNDTACDAVSDSLSSASIVLVFNVHCAHSGFSVHCAHTVSSAHRCTG